jgi:hypothetical protein
MNKDQKSTKPWYAPQQQESSKTAQFLENAYNKIVKGDQQTSASKKHKTLPFFLFLMALIACIAAGVFFSIVFWPNAYAIARIISATLALMLTALSLILALHAIGSTVARLLQKDQSETRSHLGFRLLRNTLAVQEVMSTVPAPELALQNFVAQVRAYSAEVAYQKGRENRAAANSENPKANLPDTTDLLKRRWAEVVDSLNEFEIYLANDPSTVIEKLATTCSTQNMDVSQIFRDVAESFDTTWRRKGINIESAIVTPLKATANEALLRRLLVGPWRASAYFARRGNGVVFSAKSTGGKVIASWDCHGLNMPDAYLSVAQNSQLSVNERVEHGMRVLTTDPSSSNTFLALLSFVIWIDLAKACAVDYAFKHTNDGFAIELRLS